MFTAACETGGRGFNAQFWRPLICSIQQAALLSIAIIAAVCAHLPRHAQATALASSIHAYISDSNYLLQKCYI